jgi:galactokinase
VILAAEAATVVSIVSACAAAIGGVLAVLAYLNTRRERLTKAAHDQSLATREDVILLFKIRDDTIAAQQDEIESLKDQVRELNHVHADKARLEALLEFREDENARFANEIGELRRRLAAAGG